MLRYMIWDQRFRYMSIAIYCPREQPGQPYCFHPADMGYILLQFEELFRQPVLWKKAEALYHYRQWYCKLLYYNKVLELGQMHSSSVQPIPWDNKRLRLR